MSANVLQEIVSDTERAIKSCQRYVKFNRIMLAVNLTNGAIASLDIWSRDNWWNAGIALLCFSAAAFTVWWMRRLRRRVAAYRVIRKNTLRLIEAEKVLYLTTTPAESALEQLVASMEELKRI